MRGCLLIPILLLLIANTARADWTEVRELVRKGDRIKNQDARTETYRKAYQLAIQSVKAQPKSSNEYLWLANSAGRLGQHSPTKEKIELSKVVKDNAIYAIQLDPKNGPAYMTLGAWHFYVADLNWLERSAAKLLYGALPPASYKDAVANLTKALELGCDNPAEVLYLRGRSYEELDQDTKAKDDYRACIKTPANNEEERTMQADAQDRL